MAKQNNNSNPDELNSNSGLQDQETDNGKSQDQETDKGKSEDQETDNGKSNDKAADNTKSKDNELKKVQVIKVLSDPKNRLVYLRGKKGDYEVQKPNTGFIKSKIKTLTEARAIFEHEVISSQN